MGSSRWDSSAYASYSSSTKAAYGDATTASARSSMFKTHSASNLKPEFNPLNIKVRESRDSVENPLSTPISLWLDATGSMGSLAGAIAQEGLGKLIEEIYSRKPVTDPHVLVGVIGDVECDQSPLQATQYEADIRLVEQLTSLYLEGGGGGNGYESYTAPWYFAATRVSADNFDKRGKKGFLFTVGDEPVNPVLTKSAIKRFFGDDVQADLSAAELLNMVERTHHVFHIVIEEGSCFRTRPDSVKKSWDQLLGQNVIYLSDYKKLAEVVVSTIQVINGEDAKTVSASWSGNTSVVVASAIRSLRPITPTSGGVVTL